MHSPTGVSHRRQVVVAAIALAAITIAATWPVITDPGHLSLVRPADNDFRLNNYLISWGAHALSGDPLALHHTNMFHPERYTFAYADMLLAQSLLMLPVILAFQNPVLTFNLLLMFGFVIGGTGFFTLARHITGHPGAAFLGALLWVFNPVHFTRFQQIQLVGDHWLPWMCWALWRWLEAPDDDGPRLRWGAAATGFFCLNALSGAHPAVFGALIGGLIVAWFTLRRRPPMTRRRLQELAICCGAAFVVLAPLFFPYLLLENDLAASRAETLDLANASLRPLEALSARSQLYLWLDATVGWPSAFLNPEGAALHTYAFPGLVTLGLALAALFAAPASMRDALRFWLLACGVALFFALGAYGAYAVAGDVPVLRLVRVPTRFLMPAIFAMAMIATIGAAACCRRLARPRAAAAVLLALGVAFAAEASFVPLRTWDYAQAPRRLNQFLAAQPGDFAVLEIPLDPFGHTINMRQVSNSIFHWKRLLVGYSGYQSQDNIDLLRRIRDRFPSDRCIDELTDLNVRFVVVLKDRVDADLLAAVRRQSRLVPTWSHHSQSVYRIGPATE